MQLARIHAQNFIGARRVDVEISTPIVLFAGRNGAGKSSLRDAIALALVADLGRVGLKKDASQLITDGADAATCQLVDSEGDEFGFSITKGKLTHTLGKREPDAVLPFVLDAQTFARLDLKARRTFLYDLMGVKTEPADIKARLVARLFAGRKETAAETARVERVMPLLRGGFEGAKTEADRQATEARAAWKLIAGEVYGSEKAKTWKAKVPPFDKAAAAKLQTKLKHCDAALESWQRSAGGLQAEEKRRGELRTQLATLQQTVDLEKRRRDKLEADQGSVTDLERQILPLAEAAGETPRVGLVHDLARAGQAILGDYFEEGNDQPSVVSMRLALADYVKAHGALGTGVGDPNAAAKLPELRRSLDMAQRAVVNSQRDLDAVLQAKAEAARITEELAEVFDAAALADANQKIDEFRAQRTALQQQAEQQRSIAALVESAEQKTKDAAEHHANVVGWEAIGEALAPDGIPGDILAEALGPMNARLAQSAADAAWPAVVIGTDMEITAGGRAYRLLSASEKWRCDAMIAEAVSHISGAQLLVLDAADVLDIPARGELYSWLDTLALQSEIATALVFATLKALPTDLPDTFAAHWVAEGRVEQTEPERAAA